MNALALADRIASSEGLRVFPVVGDMMEPTFYRGDFALVAPVDRWEGDGCYVLGSPFGPGLYRCRRRDGRVIVRGDNERYAEEEMSLADFDADVLAKAILKMNVMDRSRLPDALRF